MTYRIGEYELRFNHAGGFGQLGWTNKWESVHKLVDSGHLRSEHHGASCYGHTSYYLTDKGRAEAQEIP